MNKPYRIHPNTLVAARANAKALGTCPKCEATVQGKAGLKTHIRYCGRERELFWARVTKGDGCWPFQGYRDKWGYGHLAHKMKRIQAHRYAYEITKGAIPDGMIVIHSCDNPICCNPDHLSVGTWKDNKQDCIQKGRHRHRYTPKEELLHPHLSRRFKDQDV